MLGHPAPRTWPRLFLWILAAALGVQMVLWLGSVAKQPSHSFVSHYTASRLVLEGSDVRHFYDDEWFRREVARFQPTVSDIYGTNLPTTALLMLPFASLEYTAAKVLWTSLSLLMMIGALWWATRLADTGPEWTPFLFCVAFLYHPAYSNVVHGTMYLMAFALLVLAWWAYRSGRQRTVGATVGFLFAAKSTALTYWPLLLVRRRWRALAWGGGLVAAVVVISLPILGAGAWPVYFDRASDLLSQPSLAVTWYQTVPSWFRQMLMYDPVMNPDPVANLPRVAAALSWIVGASMLGLSALVAWRRDDDLVFGAFAALWMMLSPVSTETHYAMILLPVVILVGRLRGRMLSLEGLLFLGAVVLVGLELPYGSPKVTGGAWAVFAYPRLYGAFVIWALSLYLVAEGVSRERRPGRLS